MTEGDRRYRAEIDRRVKKRAKFKMLDSVKVLIGTNKGKIGFVHTVSAVIDIKDMSRTNISYLVRFGDGRSGLYAYDENELQKTNAVIPEKVAFT